MKRVLVLISGVAWIITLSLMMTNCFAWEQYDEKTAINSDYNKAESNPKNYKKDEGFGLNKAY